MSPLIESCVAHFAQVNHAALTFTEIGCWSMRLSRWLHRQFAWLALCAVLFGAFAPSVSKLLAVSNGIAWIEVCSAQGAKKIAIDSESKQHSEIPLIADNHCGYCLLQQHSPFIPTHSLTLGVTPHVFDRLAIGTGGTTIFKRLVRDARHTRAPPIFSWSWFDLNARWILFGLCARACAFAFKWLDSIQSNQSNCP